MHVPLETKEKIGMGHVPGDCIAGPQVTKYCQIASECLNPTTLCLAFPLANICYYPASQLLSISSVKIDISSFSFAFL